MLTCRDWLERLILISRCIMLAYSLGLTFWFYSLSKIVVEQLTGHAWDSHRVELYARNVPLWFDPHLSLAPSQSLWIQSWLSWVQSKLLALYDILCLHKFHHMVSNDESLKLINKVLLIPVSINYTYKNITNNKYTMISYLSISDLTANLS